MPSHPLAFRNKGSRSSPRDWPPMVVMAAPAPTSQIKPTECNGTPTQRAFESTTHVLKASGLCVWHLEQVSMKVSDSIHLFSGATSISSIYLSVSFKSWCLLNAHLTAILCMRLHGDKRVGRSLEKGSWRRFWAATVKLKYPELRLKSE